MVSEAGPNKVILRRTENDEFGTVKQMTRGK